jgi:hypothetical protein
MRRPLLFVGLLLLLACQTSFAAPVVPSSGPPVGTYDVLCGVPIPAQAKIRSLPNADTCQASLTADQVAHEIHLPGQAKWIDATNRALDAQGGYSNTTGMGNYVAECNTPIPADAKVLHLPDAATCYGALTADQIAHQVHGAASSVIDTPKEYAAAESIILTADTARGWTTYPAANYNGILGYMGATYPLAITPTDGRAFAINTSLLKPANHGCSFAAMQRVRQDPDISGGSADTILFDNACALGTNQIVWGLNDPAVQQYFVLNGGSGKVVAAQVKQTTLVYPPCFTSYIFDQTRSLWAVVESVCGYYSNSNGIIQMQGLNLDQPTPMCLTMAVGPWMEAVFRWKSDTQQWVPITLSDLSNFTAGRCVTQQNKWPVTSTIFDPYYGMYAYWRGY